MYNSSHLLFISLRPMETLILKPLSGINGEVQIPGSKSLSNRILLLAAQAEGITEVTNLLDSDDVRHMLTALRQLDVDYTLSNDKTTCQITGLGRTFQSNEILELFLGNAGTAMRPLTAALCAGQGEFTLTLSLIHI